MPKEKQDDIKTVVEAVADVFKAVNRLSTSFEKFKADTNLGLRELQRVHDEDVRAMTARVARVATNVTYMRENVCQQLKDHVSSEQLHVTFHVIRSRLPYRCRRSTSRRRSGMSSSASRKPCSAAALSRRLS